MATTQFRNLNEVKSPQIFSAILNSYIGKSIDDLDASPMNFEALKENVIMGIAEIRREISEIEKITRLIGTPNDSFEQRKKA